MGKIVSHTKKLELDADWQCISNCGLLMTHIKIIWGASFKVSFKMVSPMSTEY